jgi:hypothetical protein
MTTKRVMHTYTSTNTLPMRIVRTLTHMVLQRLEREHTHKQQPASSKRTPRSAWMDASSI